MNQDNINPIKKKIDQLRQQQSQQIRKTKKQQERQYVMEQFNNRAKDQK